MFGLSATLRHFVFGSPPHTRNIVKRGTSRKEATAGHAIFRRGATSEEIAIHAMVNSKHAVSFSDASIVARQFSCLHVLGSAVIMMDTWLLHDSHTAEHVERMTAGLEGGFPEAEQAIVKSVPPAVFIGYQEGISVFSFGRFVCNELYVDRILLGSDYEPVFEKYLKEYQQMIFENWQNKNAATYTGAGPVFSEEAFEAFIKLNVDFYTKVNQLHSQKLKNIVEVDENGNEKETNITERYNIKEVEIALRKLFGNLKSLESENKLSPVHRLK
jgi:hypothetical protein